MRVSKMTVYRLVHNGELPAVRVGRSFRVHAKAVHDLLETLVLRRWLARTSRTGTSQRRLAGRTRRPFSACQAAG